MTAQWRFLKEYKVLIIIILLSSLLRFVGLDKIPTAITGDELLYAVTAKAVYLTGHDISGKWNPLSIFVFQYPPGEHQAELPYFIHLAFSGPFPFSLFMAKLPFALLSMGIVILIYKIAGYLFDKETAEVAGLIAAINPWLIVMGRTAYESTPSTFFYLLSLYLLLKLRSWNVLWSLIPLLLAFYSYIGTKLIFIPFTLIALFLTYEINAHRFKKIYITEFAICLCFVIGYLLLLFTSSGTSRISELVFPNSLIIKNLVDATRTATVQTPFLSLFVNKYTVYIQLLMEKLMRIFSPSYLFIEGDQFFLPVKQSFFYAIDFIFIILGSLYLFAQRKKTLLALASFILIGTFPHIFHETQGDFSGHLALMFPFLILLIAVGISEIISSMPKMYRAATAITIILLYCFSLLGFSVAYFYQYPLVGAGDFHMRVLSRYLSLNRSTAKQITVYTTTSSDLLKKYIFYTNSMNKQTMPELRRIYLHESNTEFQNIRFVSCDNTIKSNNNDNLFIYDVKCGMNIASPHIQISRLTDAGGIYEIYNDTLCSKYGLNHYPMGVKTSDFSVENLSTTRFCKIYFNN